MKGRKQRKYLDQIYVKLTAQENKVPATIQYDDAIQERTPQVTFSSTSLMHSTNQAAQPTEWHEMRYSTSVMQQVDQNLLLSAIMEPTISG
jgi:hypothetical protein